MQLPRPSICMRDRFSRSSDLFDAKSDCLLACGFVRLSVCLLLSLIATISLDRLPTNAPLTSILRNSTCAPGELVWIEVPYLYCFSCAPEKRSCFAVGFVFVRCFQSKAVGPILRLF